MRHPDALIRSVAASALAAGLLLAAPAPTSAAAASEEEEPLPAPRPPSILPGTPAASAPLLEGVMPWIHAGRAWLGIQIDEVNGEPSAPPEAVHGARVTAVDEDGPAARAGVKTGDVIVTYQSQRVESAIALMRMVRETPPGRTVRLGVKRGGTLHPIGVTLEERPAASRRGAPPGIEVPDFDLPDPRSLHGRPYAEGPRLGIEAEPVDGQLAAYFGVGENGGVLVREVRPDSPAGRAGIKAGDVIVRAGKTAVPDVDALRDALREAEGNRVTLGIVRDRAEQSIEVDLAGTGHGAGRHRTPRPPRPPAEPDADAI